MSDERSPADRVTPRNIALSDEAIDWVVRLGSGSATADDHAAFDEWRGRSPAHEAAAAEAASILEDIANTRTAGEYREIGAAIRDPLPPPSTRRINRRTVLTGGVAAAAAIGITSSGVFGPPSGLLSDYATGVGGHERIVLGDGSVVWLNTATALSLDFSARERRLTLHAGEALFEVAKDQRRPFIVMSGYGEARAVGTVYSVRQRGPVNDVVVTEGIVEVRNGRQTVRLSAGQQVAYGDGIQSAVRLVDGQSATAWSRGKLIFNRRPLAEVADELERYQLGKVVVRDERLKSLEVTGVFDLGDTKTLLRTISGTLNIPIIRLPLLTIIG